jgi:hypothetical protein
MRTPRRLVLLSALLIVLSAVGSGQSQEQPRYGGVITWLEYADPARLDFSFRITAVRLTGGGRHL